MPASLNGVSPRTRQKEREDESGDMSEISAPISRRPSATSPGDGSLGQWRRLFG